MCKKLFSSTIHFNLAKAHARTRICPRNAFTRHLTGALSVRFLHRHEAENLNSRGNGLVRAVYSRPPRDDGLLNSIGTDLVRATKPHYVEHLPRQATIISSAIPSSDIQDFIIQRLKRKLCMSKAAYHFYRTKGQQGLAILATPKYARWLEDDAGFIPRVLNAITRSWKQHSAHERDVMDFDVMSACVDGLPPSVEFMPNSSKALEGFSFLHGISEDILPNLFVEDEPATGGQEALSSLTFSGEGSFEANVTLPLANTLFVNGKISSFRASRWRREQGGQFVKTKSMDKHHQVINAFTGMADEMLSYIPATPLTPTRIIASGLGNIVRSIEFDDGPGPASRELELSVDRYRERLVKIESPESVKPFGIWALVVPRAAIEKNRKREIPYNLQMNMAHIPLATPDQVHDYIGNWIKQGAFLCRVLSGGGGWGAKQGLLSLDPQTTYQKIEQPQLDFAFDTIEEQQASALGNIAKPGDLIQFYVANPSKANSTPDKRFNDFDPKKRTITIGTAPSTIDSMPEKGDDFSTSDIRVRNGHFGALSQSGIYLSQKIPGDGLGSPSFTTKLDVPHSYVFGWTDSAVLPTEPSEEPKKEAGEEGY